MDGGGGIYEAAYQFVNHNIAEVLFDQPHFDYHFASLALDLFLLTFLPLGFFLLLFSLSHGICALCHHCHSPFLPLFEWVAILSLWMLEVVLLVFVGIVWSGHGYFLFRFTPFHLFSFVCVVGISAFLHLYRLSALFDPQIFSFSFVEKFILVPLCWMAIPSANPVPLPLPLPFPFILFIFLLSISLYYRILGGQQYALVLFESCLFLSLLFQVKIVNKWLLRLIGMSYSIILLFLLLSLFLRILSAYSSYFLSESSLKMWIRSLSSPDVFADQRRVNIGMNRDEESVDESDDATEERPQCYRQNSSKRRSRFAHNSQCRLSLRSICFLIAIVLSVFLEGMCDKYSPIGWSTSVTRRLGGDICVTSPCFVYLLLPEDNTSSSTIVVFHSPNRIIDPMVKYHPIEFTKDGNGTSLLPLFAKASEISIENEFLTRFVYTVTLDDLLADTLYTLQAGSLQQWSQVYTFRSLPPPLSSSLPPLSSSVLSSPSFPPPLSTYLQSHSVISHLRFIVGGDLGVSESASHLMKMSLNVEPRPHFVVLGGDLAYEVCFSFLFFSLSLSLSFCLYLF
jgi:hypothetical protein